VRPRQVVEQSSSTNQKDQQKKSARKDGSDRQFVKIMSNPSGHERHVQTEDEPDEWEQRIDRGGCAKEHYKLQDCYMGTKDWRKCKEEACVSSFHTDGRWKHSKHAGRKSQTILGKHKSKSFELCLSGPIVLINVVKDIILCREYE